MSIELEQDGKFPPRGTSSKRPTADEAAAKAAEDDARFEAVKRRVKDADPDTLNWAEKLARNAALEDERLKKAKADTASANTSGAPPPKARATRSKKPNDQAVQATITNDQVAVTQKSTSSRKTKTPHADKEVPGNIEAAPAATAKPKRTRRKVSADLVSKSDGAAVPPDKTTSRSIPPITSEAITFLNDPDAKATSYFKLAPDSQAFVQYHITNMQWLEADSVLAHTHLLATAPKRSPRFEKALDTLVVKLARDRPILVNAANNETEPTQAPATAAKKRNANYGPQQAAITVSLAKRFPRGVNEQINETTQENTIELSVSVEKAPQPTQNTQPSSQEVKDFGTNPIPRSAHRGQILKRGMETVVRAAALWLQDKGQKVHSTSKPVPSSLPAEPPTPASDRHDVVPEDVARRFLKVDREYYFRDKTPAFSDRGNKLATRGEHPEVVRSLVDIAIARGWNNITVKGTESFRRAAWMEAAQSGLKVAGYQPTALDLADLANRPAKNVIEKWAAKDHQNPSPVAEHKPAAKTVDEGLRTTLTTAPTKDNATDAKDAELLAKARSFEKDKPSFVVKKHPDLSPAYGVIDAAKKFAELSLPGEVKEEFIGIARRYVMNKIILGEAVVGPKVFMASAKSKDPAHTSKTTNEKQAIEGKHPRAKEVARER